MGNLHGRKQQKISLTDVRKEGRKSRRLDSKDTYNREKKNGKEGIVIWVKALR